MNDLSFDPTDLEAMLWASRRPDYLSAWHGHVAFAHWLVDIAHPGCIVELGTEHGVSYASFCHATAARGRFAKCFAIDTWQGDDHTGTYSDAVFDDLNVFNQTYYGFFSMLLRMRFEDAVAGFDDGSIDLLHIDGLHTYDAVRNDFLTWLPKVSDRGVVLFHDTAIREKDFGVWKLWAELSDRYPSFRFDHAAGLGVLLVGRNQPAKLRALCALGDSPMAALVRANFELFSALAQRVSP